MKLRRPAPLLPKSVQNWVQQDVNVPPQYYDVPPQLAGLFQAEFLIDPKVYAQIKSFADDGNESRTVDILTSIVFDDLLPLDVVADDYQHWRLRYFARIHAICALCGIAPSDAALPARFIPLLCSDHDDLKDELPALFASFGPGSLGLLRPLVEDRDQVSETRQRAATCMEKIAGKHPESREDVVRFISSMLQVSGDDFELAGSLVANLVDLDARDRLPLIEAAYQEGRVDSGIIPLSDVYEEFGIVPGKRK